MIAFLKGILDSKNDQGCWVDVNGIGYEVNMPLPDVDKLPALGDAVIIYTCLVKREEEDRLFGFLQLSDRKLFQLLLTISNVGPKMALAVLSGMSRDELEQAVAHQDVDRFTRVPGIGRKTAERLLLELKDKIDVVKLTPRPAGGQEAGELAEALEALTTLGYSRTQARLAMQKVLDQGPVKPTANSDQTAELIRRALKYM